MSLYVVIKVLSQLFTGLGSILLAWRVKQLLDAMHLSQLEAGANYYALVSFLTNKSRDLMIVGGADKHVEQSKKSGKLLLISGLSLLGGGVALGAWATIIKG